MTLRRSPSASTSFARSRTCPGARRGSWCRTGCGFTYAEIARMTGATYRTVDRQLRRARERLRDADEQTLAARETQILDRLVDGLTIRAIALALDIGEETVRGYLLGAYRKLGVRTRGQAVPSTSRDAHRRER